MVNEQSEQKEQEGSLTGYEMQVTCPECGYPTDAEEISPSAPVVCGEGFKQSDNHGCGRELVTTVQVVEAKDSPSKTQPENDSKEYEVLISPEGGYEQEHAQLLRQRLLSDGFHDNVVSVQQRGE